MSYEVPESVIPVFDFQLPPALQRKFHALFDEITCLYRINIGEAAVKAAAVRLYKNIKTAVSAYPVLAQTINSKANLHSLLEIASIFTGYHCNATTKFLIETNPCALVWAHPDRDGNNDRGPIHFLGENGWNCALLPWVAQHYPWVFRTDLCQTKPPHLAMTRHYVGRQCSLEIARAFYELYPQGLREKDRTVANGRYPLSVSLEGSEEPNADFFIWMATRYPKAVYHNPSGGHTVLHVVCTILAANYNDSVLCACTPNMAKICRYLIAEHPSLIRQKARDGYLPLHMLAKSCNRPLVREMVVLLLKAYPESVQVKAGGVHPELSSVPFIQKVHSLIVDEMDIHQEMSMLAKISGNMKKSADLSKTPGTLTNGSSKSVLKSSLLDSVAEVLLAWAHLRVSDVLTAEKQRVQKRIADTCRQLGAVNLSVETDDEDSWDEGHSSYSDDEDDSDVSDEEDVVDESVAFEFESERDDIADRMEKLQLRD